MYRRVLVANGHQIFAEREKIPRRQLDTVRMQPTEMTMFIREVFLCRLTHNSGPLHRVIRAGAARRSTNASLMPRRTNCKPTTHSGMRERERQGGRRRQRGGGGGREVQREAGKRWKTEVKGRRDGGDETERKTDKDNQPTTGWRVGQEEGPCLNEVGWGGRRGGGGGGGAGMGRDVHAVILPPHASIWRRTGERSRLMRAGVD